MLLFATAGLGCVHMPRRAAVAPGAGGTWSTEYVVRRGSQTRRVFTTERARPRAVVPPEPEPERLAHHSESSPTTITLPPPSLDITIPGPSARAAAAAARADALARRADRRRAMPIPAAPRAASVSDVVFEPRPAPAGPMPPSVATEPPAAESGPDMAWPWRPAKLLSTLAGALDRGDAEPAAAADPDVTPGAAPSPPRASLVRAPMPITDDGRVHLEPLPGRALHLAAGPTHQSTQLDMVFGTATSPARVHGLALPEGATLTAWAEEPADMLPVSGGGVIVRYGTPGPDDLGGAVTGRLRDRGWLAVEIESGRDNPIADATALAAAIDELRALQSLLGRATLAGPQRTDTPPVVVVGIGESTRHALSVARHADIAIDAVVLVSDASKKRMSVASLELSAGRAAFPVLHLRPSTAADPSNPADPVGRPTSAASLLTRWDYARPPREDAAKLDALADPVTDWIEAVTAPHGGHHHLAGADE